MGKKLTFYCDICKKEVDGSSSLFDIDFPEVNWDRDTEWKCYEACIGCYNKYEKEMFRLKENMLGGI